MDGGVRQEEGGRPRGERTAPAGLDRVDHVRSESGRPGGPGGEVQEREGARAEEKREEEAAPEDGAAAGAGQGTGIPSSSDLLSSSASSAAAAADGRRYFRFVLHGSRENHGLVQ